PRLRRGDARGARPAPRPWCWTDLLRHTFAVDVLSCPRCGSTAYFRPACPIPWACSIPCEIAVISIPLVEPARELKNRKKLEPTSIPLPAASASSITLDDVMPLLPSAAGQSLCCMTSTGLTSHQIALLLTRLLSTTWL